MEKNKIKCCSFLMPRIKLGISEPSFDLENRIKESTMLRYRLKCFDDFSERKINDIVDMYLQGWIYGFEYEENFYYDFKFLVLRLSDKTSFMIKKPI